MNRRQMLALGVASIASVAMPLRADSSEFELFPLPNDSQEFAIYASFKANLPNNLPGDYVWYLIKSQQFHAGTIKIPSGWRFHCVRTIANDNYVQTALFTRRVS